MTDTPEHIKKLHLNIWLSKTHSERLEQFLRDNDAFLKMIKAAKNAMKDETSEKSQEI